MVPKMKQIVAKISEVPMLNEPKVEQPKKKKQIKTEAAEPRPGRGATSFAEKPNLYKATGRVTKLKKGKLACVKSIKGLVKLNKQGTGKVKRKASRKMVSSAVTAFKEKTRKESEMPLQIYIDSTFKPVKDKPQTVQDISQNNKIQISQKKQTGGNRSNIKSEVRVDDPCAMRKVFVSVPRKNIRDNAISGPGNTPKKVERVIKVPIHTKVKDNSLLSALSVKSAGNLSKKLEASNVLIQQESDKNVQDGNMKSATILSVESDKNMQKSDSRSQTVRNVKCAKKAQESSMRSSTVPSKECDLKAQGMKPPTVSVAVADNNVVNSRVEIKAKTVTSTASNITHISNTFSSLLPNMSASPSQSILRQEPMILPVTVNIGGSQQIAYVPLYPDAEGKYKLPDGKEVTIEQASAALNVTANLLQQIQGHALSKPAGDGNGTPDTTEK